MKYHLFLSKQGRHTEDGGGQIIPLKAQTIEEARVEARSHIRQDCDVVTTDAEILVIEFREVLDVGVIL